ncbi:MAG: putative protein YqgN [Myxococcota bacterium]|nr:putative protein YqgN [Myxococcota bacterium]
MEQQKESLRRHMRVLREQYAARLTPGDWRLAGENMARMLSTILAVRRSAVISFCPRMGLEPDLAAIHCVLREAGAGVALPRIIPGPERGMEFVIGGELKRGPLGISQPAGGTVIPPDAVELALVPALAADLNGRRLGHGAGYYDRYLARLRAGTPKIACIFDFQVLEKVPAAAHDIPMDAILTGQRWIPLRIQSG